MAVHSVEHWVAVKAVCLDAKRAVLKVAKKVVLLVAQLADLRL